ncbi:MAG: DUF86 domain-containing protein [Chloroflexota bacterium]|nr:DUF86 domain-containing protein [Chloroflexota bacterium]MDE2946152.1 DUF86 domain-containing protein [Chloroflexota bacterium]
MRDAAQYAQQFAAGREIEGLNTDIQFRMALVKAVELVGESASHTSDELRAQQPQLPWKKMIGMRNVLVHNYWAIEQEEFWDAVQIHIPALITELERLIKLEDERRMK